jgi:hypothetical protein
MLTGHKRYSQEPCAPIGAKRRIVDQSAITFFKLWMHNPVATRRRQAAAWAGIIVDAIAVIAVFVAAPNKSIAATRSLAGARALVAIIQVSIIAFLAKSPLVAITAPGKSAMGSAGVVVKGIAVVALFEWIEDRIAAGCGNDVTAAVVITRARRV